MIQLAAETSGSIGMGSGLAVVIIALLLVFAGGTGGAEVNPFSTVELSCEATVGNETIRATTVVAQQVYDDPTARQFVAESLRRALMDKILQKWTPVIRVR